MPRLWANVISDLTEDYPPAPLFHLVLERSNPSLIDIDLWGAGDLHKSYPFVNPQINPDVSYANMIGSLNCLPPHIHRCRRFKVVITDHEAASAFATIPFSLAGNLEEVELATQCGQDVDNLIFTTLRGLTALRRLTLLGFRHNATIRQAMPVFPWHQLLHLDLSYPIPSEEVFWLLRSCTSAVTMRIKANMTAGYDGPVVGVPNLRALNLSVCGRNIYRSLRRIEAPNLEVFCLETRREVAIYETPAELPSEDQFFWPSVLNKEYSLRVLVINDPSSPYDDAMRLLLNEYIKGIPVVKMGIRPMEFLYQIDRNPQLCIADTGMLGWVDEQTIVQYGADSGLLSSVGISMCNSRRV